MYRQTLRDWVHRYNAQGVEGLCRSCLVEAGPDPTRHGVVRQRCVDLRAEIKARFEVEISERHIERLLKRLGFTRLSVRSVVA